MNQLSYVSSQFKGATDFGYSGYSTCLFFPSMFFCGEAAKKTSIDGLKWRDLVVVVVVVVVVGKWWWWCHKGFYV